MGALMWNTGHLSVLLCKDLQINKNVGSNTHSELDAHLKTMPWLLGLLYIILVGLPYTLTRLPVFPTSSILRLRRAWICLRKDAAMLRSQNNMLGDFKVIDCNAADRALHVLYLCRPSIPWRSQCVSNLERVLTANRNLRVKYGDS